MPEKIRRIALGLEYQGTNYFGLQKQKTTDQTIQETKEILKKNKQIKKGDPVISLASMPANDKGMTNMIKLSIVN